MPTFWFVFVSRFVFADKLNKTSRKVVLIRPPISSANSSATHVGGYAYAQQVYG